MHENAGDARITGRNLATTHIGNISAAFDAWLAATWVLGLDVCVCHFVEVYGEKKV